MIARVRSVETTKFRAAAGAARGGPRAEADHLNAVHCTGEHDHPAIRLPLRRSQKQPRGRQQREAQGRRAAQRPRQHDDGRHRPQQAGERAQLHHVGHGPVRERRVAVHELPVSKAPAEEVAHAQDAAVAPERVHRLRVRGGEETSREAVAIARRGGAGL